MAAALPTIIPHRMTPWPPRPPTLISVLAMGRSIGLIAVAEHAGKVLVHGVQPGWPFAVDELADDDVALEPEGEVLGVRVVPNGALLFVVLELVHSVPSRLRREYSVGQGDSTSMNANPGFLRPSPEGPVSCRT